MVLDSESHVVFEVGLLPVLFGKGHLEWLWDEGTDMQGQANIIRRELEPKFMRLQRMCAGDINFSIEF